MAYMRSGEKAPLDYGAEEYEEEGLEDTTAEQVPDKLRNARIMSAVANAIAQRTSAPIETAFYAFTGEKLPSHQGATKPTTALDYMEQEQKIEGEQSEQELRKAQIEKYLAEAKGKEKAANEQWYDTGMRTRTDDAKNGAAIFMNRKTGETRSVQVPPGTVDRIDLQAAQALGLAGLRSQESAADRESRERMAEENRKLQEKLQQMRGDQAVKTKQTPAAPKAQPSGGKPLSDKQIEGIGEIDSAISAAEALNDAYDRLGGHQYVGRVRGNLPDVLTDFVSPSGGVGKSDPNESSFRLRAQQMFNAYQKYISGASVPVTEVPRLQKAVPGLGDPPEKFKAKLNEYLSILKENRNSYINTLRRGGKDISEFQSTGSETGGPPAGAVKLKGRDGYWMKTPDGKAYKRVQ